LVNSLTIELDKILYKNFEEEEENDYEKGEEKNNIEEVKNVENKNTIILKESLPKGLKLNDLENIKMIAKFMNKLTLSEQRRVNFPKAIELLVALHESDRIIENKNKICVNKNLIYSKKGKGKIEEIEEYLRDIVNIKKAKFL